MSPWDGVPMVFDWGVLVSVLGAAGVGSVVGTAYTQRKDRREARAKALDAIAELQVLLGPMPDLAGGVDFTHVDTVLLARTVARIRSAMLVAGARRGVVEEYLVSSVALARWHNQRDFSGDLVVWQWWTYATVISVTWQPSWAWVTRPLPVMRSRRFVTSIKPSSARELVADVRALWP